ncbi:Homogentisate 1,2-dioxygenase [Hyaloraphidium curvatum]|nr:Homogentisate 1,2-dioxygenase [Hyaloraphidium curvatum]
MCPWPDFSTEALPGALPVGQNQPQRCAYDLYAEGITGTTFTTPRSHGLGNQRTWLYRIRPTIALTSRFQPYHGNKFITSDFVPRQYLHPSQGLPSIASAPQSGHAIAHNPTAGELSASGGAVTNGPLATPVPNVLQWNPLRIPSPDEVKLDFVDGIRTMAGCGSVMMRDGLAYHLYVANTSMEKRAFYNADGGMCIFPQTGVLDVWTEMGRLSVAPNELLVIPRGIRFSVAVSEPSRGFICEVFNASHFQLPDLGPIGSNGLANPRDFLAPVAAFLDVDEPWEVVGKYMGNLFRYGMDHAPFDVVGWHGNYYPYKYDIARFSTLGSISFDHTDPSLFTILTVPGSVPGAAVVDILTVNPPRWSSFMHSYVVPYFHRNCASEFLMQIKGQPSPKAELSDGSVLFVPTHTPHGAPRSQFERATFGKPVDKPFRLGDGQLLLMWESTYQIVPTRWWVEGSGALVTDADWQENIGRSLKKYFNGGQAKL